MARKKTNNKTEEQEEFDVDEPSEVDESNDADENEVRSPAYKTPLLINCVNNHLDKIEVLPIFRNKNFYGHHLYFYVLMNFLSVIMHFINQFILPGFRFSFLGSSDF